MQAGSNHFDGCLMPFLEKKETKIQKQGYPEDGWLISPPHVIFKVASGARQSLHGRIFFSDRLRYLPCIRWDGALINIDARI